MPYEEEKAVFVDAVSSFLEKYPDPQDLSQIESEEEKADFIIAFRDFSRTLRKIETFSEFDYADFELDEDDIATYRSHYVHMKPPHDEEKASILDDIDFEMELVLSNTINVDYIYQLLASLDVKDKGSVKKVRDMVQKGGTDKLRKKSDLLLDFIDSVVPQLTEESDVVDEYDKFVDNRVQKEIVDQSSDFGISPDTLLHILSTYRFRGKFDGALYDKETTLGFRQRLGKRKALKTLVLSLAESYEKEE
jgi:type I restriction enzyme R subunit